MTPRVTRALPIAAIAMLVIVPVTRHVLVHGLGLLATGQFLQFQQYLRSLGPWAPAASIALMTIEALAVPVPVTIVMVANGLVFGVWKGMLVSLAGGLTGAVAAYVIGRTLGRAIVERVVPATALATADRLMAKYGGWAVVLERWIPGIPGDPVSYASGLTRMRVWRFVGLTTIGLVPANLVTAFVGVQIADDVPLTYWLGGIGVAIAAWVVWRVSRKSRRERGEERITQGPR
jgi:uncharacterized membrane protein YdjX (TVP38/TMEM64 family)